MTPDEIIAVVQKFKEGREVELRPKHHGNGAWTSTLTPEWDFFHFDYRVKPEPDKVSYYYATAGTRRIQAPGDNLRLTFDGETGRLKAAEVIS